MAGLTIYIDDKNLKKAQKGTQAKLNILDNVNEHKFRKLYDSDNKSWYTGFTGRRGEDTNGEVYLANGMSNAEIRKEFPGALIKVENGIKTFRLPKVNEEVVLPKVDNKWTSVVVLPNGKEERQIMALVPEKRTNYIDGYRTTKNGIQNMINFTDPWTLPKWTMAFEDANGKPYSDRYYKLQNEYFDNGGKDNPLEYILNKDFDEVKTTGELETLNIPNALWHNTTKGTFMVSDENGNVRYSDSNLSPNEHYSVTDNVKIYRPKKTTITTIDQNAVKRNKFIKEMNDANRLANMVNTGQNINWNLQYQQGGPTHLQPWDEQRFRIWFNTLPEGIRNSNDYDYRGWWKENGSIPYKNGVHFTDKFKLPNHPTFSEESIYSKGNTEGGYWTKDGFVPSPYNTRNGSGRIIDYMEFAEPKGTKMYDTNGMVATFQNGGHKRRLKDNYNRFTKKELDFISNNWNTGQTFTDGEFVYVMPGDTASNLHNRNVKQTLFDSGLPRSNASMVSTSNGWRISHAMDERYAGNEGRSWDNYIVKYYVGDNKDLIPQNAQYITVDENGNYVLNNGVPRLNYGGPTGLSIFIDDEQFKKGGQIHIKEKNKGKFTKQAQSAGMSVQEFARHVLAHRDRYPASTVKRANFARNATKFNH